MSSATRRALSNVGLALRSLTAHPLRSSLTALGIVVGVASVVTVLAVGAGAQSRVVEQIRSLGGNLLLVLPGSAQAEGVKLGSGTRETLTEHDAQAIANEIPLVAVAAPSVFGNTQAVSGNRNWGTRIQGITSEYLAAREWGLSSGRGFTGDEIERSAKAVLLGTTVVEKLFPDADPLGAIIRVGGTPFTVVGVLESKGQTSLGTDQDDKLMVPLSTARGRILGASRVRHQSVQYIMVKVKDARYLDATEGQIRRLLRQRHRLSPKAPDDFSIRNLVELQAKREKASGALSFWLTAVASVSLIVGGISIMNILLVSVTERTREIGLHLAVGARRRDIRNQFLAEALVLAMLGGIAGLVVGVLLSLAIGQLGDLPIHIGLIGVLLAESAAAAVGVFFGLYPALKASRLSPMDALRAE